MRWLLDTVHIHKRRECCYEKMAVAMCSIALRNYLCVNLYFAFHFVSGTLLITDMQNLLFFQHSGVCENLSHFTSLQITYASGTIYPCH